MATFPLAEAMRNADCGILATVLQAVTPLFGDMPIFIFMAVSGLVLAIVTQVVHNVVLAAMFIPMLSEICLTMGGNPITLFFICYLALQIAFATPGASMQGAMMFGNGDLPRKHGYLFGASFTIINFVTMCTVGYFLGNMIF